MIQQTKEDRELSEMVQELCGGITEELKAQIPHIDLRPVISDAQIKQAILDLTPAGTMKLYEQFGEREVMQFLGDFSRGKEW